MGLALLAFAPVDAFSPSVLIQQQRRRGAAAVVLQVAMPTNSNGNSKEEALAPEPWTPEAWAPPAPPQQPITDYFYGGGGPPPATFGAYFDGNQPQPQQLQPPSAFGEQGGFDANGDGMMPSSPLCYCGVPCAQSISRTARNPDRPFWRCDNRGGGDGGCDFFEWCGGNAGSYVVGDGFGMDGVGDAAFAPPPPPSSSSSYGEPGGSRSAGVRG